MKIEKININKIKKNPNNPRILKDDKFKKLVKSIQDFPEMLEIRPIVVDNDFMVLGGNMRLQACKEAGLKEVSIIKANNLTEKQKKEFIIKDNVSFGEWDFDILANEGDVGNLELWGVDLVLDNFSEDFELPSGDKGEMCIISFTLHQSQKELLEKALKISKDLGSFNETINKNGNGNALSRIVENFLSKN